MTVNKLKIGICKNDRIFNHPGSWANVWIEYCEKAGMPYEIIDCYKSEIITKLEGFSCLLWHVNNYVIQDMLAGRSILYSAAIMGVKTFPDYNTAWHFDDKIAETYLLQSVGAPVPASSTFYLRDECIDWLENKASYPLVAKLRCGAGSNNVKLIKTVNEAVRYTKRMFSKGYKTQPSLLFKSRSQLLSSGSWAVMKARLKKLPDFLHTLSRARMFPNERGYVFFQEFIPNDGYDLKIVVIGDKLSYIGRKIRRGDFRASGGGDLFFEKSLVTQTIISSAFATSDKLGFQCMGYDFVVDKNSGAAKIIEISYGFSHTALLQSGGYFDRNYIWYNEPLNAPEEVLRMLVEEVSKA